MVEVRGKELDFRGLSGLGESGDVVEAAWNERRVTLGKFVKDAPESPKVAGKGVDTSELKELRSHIAGRAFLLFLIIVHEIDQHLGRSKVSQLDVAVLVD